MPLIQFKRGYTWWETQRTYRLGEIIEVDLDQFKELVSAGVAESYKGENEINKQIKSLSKMSKEELLDFAKERGFKITYENKELIKRSIINDLIRGENND